jgi:MFS family permease
MLSRLRNVHHAWWVMVGVMFMVASTGGAFLNSAGVFFVHIVDDLHVSLGLLTFYLTFFFICHCFIMPAVGNTLPRKNFRVMLSVCVVCLCVAEAAMAFYNEPWQWWLSGVVFGIAGGWVIIVPGPILIENWFHKRKGLAMGVAMCASGIGGAIFSPVATYFIETIGWRNAYLAIAGIVLVLAIPWTLFVFRFKPADMGLKPYGYDESASVEEAAHQPGVPKRKAVRTLAFWAVFLFCGVEALFSGYNGHLPGYAISIGFNAEFGAALLSMSMIGYVVATVIIGPIVDRVGVVKPTIVVIVIVALSMLGFVVLRDMLLLNICAFIFGINSIMITISVPFFLSDLFGNKDYAGIMAYARMSGLIGSIATTSIGFSYDALQTFTPAFLAGIVVLAFCCLMVGVVVTQKSKMRKLWEK